MNTILRITNRCCRKLSDGPRRTLNRFLDAHRLAGLDRFSRHYFTMRTQGQWARDTGEICRRLVSRYHPASVVDFGCGNGVYLDTFKRLGVKTVKGYDGSATAVAQALVPEVEWADLRQPIHPDQTYDLVLCVEVAPYLHEKYEDRLIENLLAAARPHAVIVFTASDQYPGGVHHINLKSRSCWIEKFHRHRCPFLPADTETLQHQLHLPTLFWIKNNLMIFHYDPQM